jgi:dimethylpropiothetin dethiomethylase
VESMLSKLSDHVDWMYVLREFWTLYRFSSAGGSKPIRSHQREVRNRLSAEMEKDPPVLMREPETLPVCAWLNRAFDRGLLERTAPLVRALSRVTGELVWRYGYERVPPGLLRKYAYAELLGPNGPVVSERLILGLVLFAPRCTYPTHSHDSISESYLCLSGAFSEGDAGVYAPGSLLFTPPTQAHRITTGDFEPTLLGYAWIGTAEKLGNQKMSFTRRRRPLIDSPPHKRGNDS